MSKPRKLHALSNRNYLEDLLVKFIDNQISQKSLIDEYYDFVNLSCYEYSDFELIKRISCTTSIIEKSLFDIIFTYDSPDKAIDLLVSISIEIFREAHSKIISSNYCTIELNNIKHSFCTVYFLLCFCHQLKGEELKFTLGTYQGLNVTKRFIEFAIEKQTNPKRKLIHIGKELKMLQVLSQEITLSGNNVLKLNHIIGTYMVLIKFMNIYNIPNN